MPAELKPECRELIAFQSGVVARSQLLPLGVTDDRICALLQARRWMRLQRGVYAAFTGEPCRSALLWAAVLRAGSGALSHQTAAELFGIADAPARLIHVTVPAGRHPARPGAIPGILIHRSDRVLVARHPVLQPPRTRLEETVLDLVHGAASFEEALGWLCRAAGRRVTTPDRLRIALDARARMRWRAETISALAEIAGGVQSVLEHRYVRDVEHAHGLPTARRQAKFVRGSRTIYLDNLYDAFGVAVELDGRAAHTVEERFRDMNRDNANTAAGIITLRYGWPDVTGRSCETASQIAAVLRQCGWDGLPRRCGPACRVAGR
jgi:hypothetical protein